MTAMNAIERADSHNPLAGREVSGRTSLTGMTGTLISCGGSGSCERPCVDARRRFRARHSRSPASRHRHHRPARGRRRCRLRSNRRALSPAPGSRPASSTSADQPRTGASGWTATQGQDQGSSTPGQLVHRPCLAEVERAGCGAGRDSRGRRLCPVATPRSRASARM